MELERIWINRRKEEGSNQFYIITRGTETQLVCLSSVEESTFFFFFQRR